MRLYLKKKEFYIPTHYQINHCCRKMILRSDYLRIFKERENVLKRTVQEPKYQNLLPSMSSF